MWHTQYASPVEFYIKHFWEKLIFYKINGVCRTLLLLGWQGENLLLFFQNSPYFLWYSLFNVTFLRKDDICPQLHWYLVQKWRRSNIFTLNRVEENVRETICAAYNQFPQTATVHLHLFPRLQEHKTGNLSTQYIFRSECQHLEDTDQRLILNLQ